MRQLYRRCWMGRTILIGCMMIFFDQRCLRFLNKNLYSPFGDFNKNYENNGNLTKLLESPRRTVVSVLRQTDLVPKNAPWYVAPPNPLDQIEHLVQRIGLELGALAEDKKGKNGMLLYVIHNGTLWAIEDIHRETRRFKDVYLDRWKPFEEMIKFGLDIANLVIERNASSTAELRLRLSQIMHEKIPILFDGGDWRRCARNDGMEILERYNFPYLTFAMTTKESKECTPFAIPCYEMWQRLKRTGKIVPSDWDHPGSSNEWDIHMHQNFSAYPWNNKIPKVVWRGSSTGRQSTQWQEISRFKLVLEGMKHQNTTDFAITKLNQGWQDPPFSKEIQQALGDKLADSIPFADFMKYKGILDIEGNSWSSRLGHLFCLNSVVVRVSNVL